VPNMVYEKDQTEDMDDGGEDHPSESTRYMIQSRPKGFVRAKPRPKKRSAEAILHAANMRRLDRVMDTNFF
jgi:hypothetical protein